MQGFHINSFGAAVILSTLFMGLVGAFFLIPVACIQWTWNSLAPLAFALPIITVWQAILLYIAGCCLLYISGLVQVEISAEPFDEASGLTGSERMRYLLERIRAKGKGAKKLIDKESKSEEKPDKKD
jgi:hypothetical protein